MGTMFPLSLCKLTVCRGYHHVNIINAQQAKYFLKENIHLSLTLLLSDRFLKKMIGYIKNIHN